MSGISFASRSGRLDRIQPWEELYSELARIPAKRRLARVLRKFRAFSAAYIGYFEDEVKPQVQPAQRSRLDARISSALETYWLPVARISEQYQVPHYRSVFFAVETEDAIQRSLDNLKDIVQRQLIDFAVLLYFNKSMTVHRYPYTNVGFVGMPYRLVAAERSLSLQAIPHELGHYLYWNMGELSVTEEEAEPQAPFEEQRRGFEAGARERLADMGLDASVLDTLLAWLEETFADVLGARLGGEGYLGSTQRLIELSAQSSADLVKNDGRHPIPYLRPLVVSQTLEWIGQSPHTLWDGFAAQFGIGDVSNLTVELPFSLRIAKKSSETELEFLARFREFIQDQTLQAIVVPVGVLEEGVRRIVRYINEQIDAYAEGQDSTFSVRVLDQAPLTPLDQLLGLAEARAQRAGDGRPVYEFLLEPQVLEGGHETHAHYATASFGQGGHTWASHYVDQHTHYD